MGGWGAGGWGAGASGAGGWGSGGRDRRRSAGERAAPGAGGQRAAGKPGGLDAEVVEQYFAPGERVLHATLGEGTVLAVESGGIVLVRFVNDGSERRLMASVAPLRRLRS